MKNSGQESDGAYLPTITDPVMDRVIVRARTFQSELDLSPNITSTRLNEILTDLNADWFFADHAIAVCGYLKTVVLEMSKQRDDPASDNLDNILVAPKRNEVDDAEVCTFLANDQLFTSKGILALKEVWPEEVGGFNLEATHYTLKHIFQREVNVYFSDGSNSNKPVIQNCEADIDGVLLTSLVMSDEFAERQTKELLPALTKRIMRLTAGDKDPAEKLMALHRLRIKHPDGMTMRDVSAFEQYMNTVIGIDQEATPHYLALKEDTIIFDTDNRRQNVLRTIEGDCLVNVAAVSLFNKLECKNIDYTGAKASAVPGSLEIRLKFSIFSSRQANDTGFVEVRLRDIEDLTSVRSFFHSEGEDID